MKSLLVKYNLPKRVEITLHKAKEGGYVVEFPNLDGCFTQVENLSQLDENVTDAVLTYFDVPRSKSHKVIYIPETKVVVRKKTIRHPILSAPEKFDLFISA